MVGTIFLFDINYTLISGFSLATYDFIFFHFNDAFPYSNNDFIVILL